MKLKTKLLLLLLFVSENSLVKLLLFVSEIIASEIKKQIYRIYAPINVFIWGWGWGGGGGETGYRWNYTTNLSQSLGIRQSTMTQGWLIGCFTRKLYMKICSEIDDPRGDLGHHNAINDWGNRPFFPKLFNSNWKSRRPLPPPPSKKTSVANSGSDLPLLTYRRSRE